MDSFHKRKHDRSNPITQNVFGYKQQIGVPDLAIKTKYEKQDGSRNRAMQKRLNFVKWVSHKKFFIPKDG